MLFPFLCKSLIVFLQLLPYKTYSLRFCLLICNTAIILFSKANDSTFFKAQLHSPDNSVSVQVYQSGSSSTDKHLYYFVNYKGKQVILPSELDIQLDNHLSEMAMGLKVDNHKRWIENLQLIKDSSYSSNATWKPVCGDFNELTDHYNATNFYFQKSDYAAYKMVLQVRAYNSGIAFRYFFPENQNGSYYRILAENSSFSFSGNTEAWVANWAQAPYHLKPLKYWTYEAERPLTLQLANGLVVSLIEAGLTDYSRTKFKLAETKENTIVTSMHDPADLISPFATPWRGIVIGNSYTDLMSKSSLILNLNDSANHKYKFNEWVKPGKIIRVMSLTTNDAIQNIDFAKDRGLQYILFDWKWYGPAFSFQSDATKVAIPNFDLPKIIQYATSKNIGIWLYVNQQALLLQSDSLFKVFHQWGVKGVKFGFVQVGSHRWTTWLNKAIRQAADNQIMVNIHDDWRPTGEQRTWPNLMTAEGIRGNEEMPDATHNTILPFTRMMAGAADYTFCYYNKRIKTTHAHQLALPIIYYSPLQTLFWYDKPNMYNQEPELKFWELMPTVWDETRYLFCNPSQNIAIARRTGNDWFLGAITNNDERDIDLDFSFLQPNKQYEATFFTDDERVQTNTKVALKTQNINSKTKIKTRLIASGGIAIYIKLTK